MGLRECAALARLGTHRNLIRIEQGKHDPKLDTLIRISRALNVTVADLVAGIA